MKSTPWRLCALLLSLSMSFAGKAIADASVTVCGKDAWPGDSRTDLSEALAIGGLITFACTGTINFSRSHALSKDMALNGGGKITLNGNGNRMFAMGSGVKPRVSFTAIRIEGAGASSLGAPGGVVSGRGTLLILDGTVISKSSNPIWILGGTLVIQNAELSDNPGRAIVMGPLASSVTDTVTHTVISNSRFIRNGGAVFGGTGTPVNGCDVSIKKSSFSGNSSPRDGGAFSSRCKTFIEETGFFSNHAGRAGGAIFLETGSETTMRDVQFSDNQAETDGGAIADIASFGDTAGALRIRSGRFIRNHAGSTGGAISTGEVLRIEIGGSSFVGNSSNNGGGAVRFRQSPFDVSRSLFFKNRSVKTGGAIETYCMSAPGGRIANSIIAGNRAAAAAAFYGTDVTFINASIVSNGNRPVQHGTGCITPAVIAFSNTIIEGAFSGGCYGGNSGQIFKDVGHNLQFPGKSCGPTITSAPPILGLSFAPLPLFSPASGTGNTQVCLAQPIDGRDIFGTHRPQGSACSIGAVEGDLWAAWARAAKQRPPPRRGQRF